MEELIFGVVEGESGGISRLLSEAAIPRWKSSLWEPQSVYPAIVRAPLVVLVFMLLWGVNLIVYERHRIPFQGVLPGTKNTSVSCLFKSVLSLLLYYFVLMFVMTSETFGYSIEVSVLVFYTTTFFWLYYISTISSSGTPTSPTTTGQSTSSLLASLLNLIHDTFSPGSHIAFSEVLFADALCSLSKVFKDIGVTVIAIYSRISGTPAVNAHNLGMILIAILASMPFAVRCRQCSIQLGNASQWGDTIPISINIIKYVSSFPPIWLAAFASLGYYHKQLHTLMIIFAAINSILSLGWDIVQDWGFIQFRNNGRISYYFRVRFLFPMLFYLFICTLNVFLRFSWMANMVPYFQSLNPMKLVLIVEVAEVFRRFLWNFLRVEWEIINKQDAAAKVISEEFDDEDS
jgi:hypothetical protein